MMHIKMSRSKQLGLFILLILIISSIIYGQNVFNASNNGNLKRVKYLIENGADVNYVNNQNKYSRVPLMYASDNGNLKRVKYLIESGADVNYVNEEDEYADSALMEVSDDGHLNAVKYLVGKGANVNAINGSGDTALMLASMSGHTEIVELLKAAGVRE